MSDDYKVMHLFIMMRVEIFPHLKVQIVAQSFYILDIMSVEIPHIKL